MKKEEEERKTTAIKYNPLGITMSCGLTSIDGYRGLIDSSVTTSRPSVRPSVRLSVTASRLMSEMYAMYVITMVASIHSGERNVTVLRPSVRPSVRLSVSPVGTLTVTH